MIGPLPGRFLSRLAAMKAESRGGPATGATAGIDDLERPRRPAPMRGGPFWRTAARWSVRRRPGSPAPRRRQDGGADPARRGAAQRLPADADDRGAKRRPVAPEPRIDVSDARPTRGRGPDPRRSTRDGTKLFELTDAGREQAQQYADRTRALGGGRRARRPLDPRDRLAGRPDRARRRGRWRTKATSTRCRRRARRWPRPAGRCTGSSPRNPTPARTRTRPRNVYERDDGRERR